MRQFNVITWNFNKRERGLEYYDIIPSFVRYYESKKKSERPKTREEFEKFVYNQGIYHFWAKCEWEVIISSWPQSDGWEIKIDVWEQIKANFDLVVDIVMEAIEESKKKKRKVVYASN